MPTPIPAETRIAPPPPVPTAGKLTDLEIKDAQLIFGSVWEHLEGDFGRENLRFPKEIILLGGAPRSIAILNGTLAGAVGLISMVFGVPFMTALWLPGYLFGVPGAFDVGVYFVVFGTMTAIILALEDSGEGV